MSIIIKGLDMPKNCLECRLGDGARCELTRGKIADPMTILPDCPLIEIPKGHGRLIDGDELLDRILEQPHWVVKIEEVSTSVYRDVDVLPEIRHSLAILEAEKE